MSADRWTVCPQCTQVAIIRLEEARKELQNDYGKLSVQDWLNKKNQVDDLASEKVKYTLREDYNIGIDKHLFDVNFRASCSECQFSFEFKRTEEVVER